MRIVCYPHPTLRHVSKPLRRVDAELRSIVREMFDLMYEHKGVGLAANQIDLPYRLFVTNIEADPDLNEAERVYINPVISSPKGNEEGEEGCLSIPDVVGLVKRAAKINLTAYDLEGDEISCELEDMPARVAQHEIDHLDGKLFIDRLSSTSEMAVREALREFELEFDSRRKLGEIPSDRQIAARLAQLESMRT